MATEASLDPVTLAVLRGRLEQIADEMDATLYRSAFNPIIAEAHDACHGLYDAQTGDTLVQGKSGLPVFVGAMAFAVRAGVDYIALSFLRTGADVRQARRMHDLGVATSRSLEAPEPIDVALREFHEAVRLDGASEELPRPEDVGLSGVFLQRPRPHPGEDGPRRQPLVQAIAPARLRGLAAGDRPLRPRGHRGACATTRR